MFGHGFLTREGQKMGKSLGNVLDPEVLLERCGRDAVRWYLLRDIPFGEDGDFQQQRFQDLVNNDLANTIGNLLNRTSSMARKWFADAVPPIHDANGPAPQLAALCKGQSEAYREAMQRYQFRSACEAVLQLAIDANGYLNERAPWKLMKQEGNEQAVAADLYAVLETCRWIALMLTPLVPELAGRMLSQLGLEPLASGCEAPSSSAEGAASAWLQALHWGGLQPGAPLPEPVPVLQRFELDSPL